MKNLFFILTLGSLFMLTTQCANQGGQQTSGKGFVLEGQISNAGGMKLFFDEISFSNTSSILDKADIDPSGKFNITLDNYLEEGIYRLRIGQKRGFLVLDGTEKKVEIKGSISDLEQSKQVVTGSSASKEYLIQDSKVKSGELKGAAIPAAISNMSALGGALLAFNLKNPDEEAAKAYEVAAQKLQAEHPDLVSDFRNFVNTRGNSGGANPLAPDISLNGPDGKKYTLSDLRGKVVLLDFWASWCRPCRLENPNVVNVYNKYNKEGFEVFSVSLDDERRNGMTKWTEAIKKDGLVWPYHVSDLKGWGAAPAKLYGVRSIPKTFLIDKEGKIAGTNLRGPALEPAVKELLAKK